MSFFKIHSSNENVNVTDMFTLGVSTSRGDDVKIGQFGSGCLMAALTWLRLFGESPVFFVNGEKITFSSKPVPKADGELFNQVYMHSGTKKGVPITISLEYGVKDWNDAGMALREWISNALDQGEDIRSEKSVGPANSVRNSKTGVTVFVKMNGEVVKYWSKIGENFLHYSERQDVKILSKPQIGPLKVYRRGVLIRSFDTEMSLYDYNLDFDITENRNGSSDSMLQHIMDTLAYNYSSATEDKHRIKILDNVISGEQTIETVFDCWTSIGRSWVKMLMAKGGTYVPVSGENIGKAGSYVVPEKWYEMIINLCPELDGMINVSMAEKRGYTTIAATQDVKDNFQRCWDFLDMLGLVNDSPKPKLECFKTDPGSIPSCLGFYTPASGTISIWNDQRASLQTMLEEVCHHITGESDCTRGFQEFLFRSLTETIENF